MISYSAAALWLLALGWHGCPASASSISWHACPQHGNKMNATTCGTLQVPLDYTGSTSDECLTLQLVKINATTQPSKGSIIFDFGGPGNINVNYLAEADGKALLLLTGGAYDLVTFEPRGTGVTLPYSCYKSSAARTAAAAAAPQALDGSNKTFEAAWAAAGALADACYENMGKTGDLVGTSFVARDIMQIVDALGEDGLLRYYGFSYGTALGATVAAMFPDRIDKLVLDGVSNPAEYWAGPQTSYLHDTDATLSAFFTGCIESPHLCPLAQIDDSAGDLSRHLASALDKLKLSARAGNSTDALEYGSVKTAIISALYFPATWPSLAYEMATLLGANVSTSASPKTPAIFPPSLFPDFSGSEHGPGIFCADSALRTNNPSDLLPIIAEMEAESWIRGDADVAISLLECARWKFSSKERYTGSFSDIQTKSPALVVGNSIDPTTPLTSARNLSEGLQGSVLLQNNGYGHTTQASPSLCIARNVRAYFVNGTLPRAGTVCESVTSTQPPFAFDGNYYEALSPLAKATKRSVDSLSDEDHSFIMAVREFGEGLAKRKMAMRARSLELHEQ